MHTIIWFIKNFDRFPRRVHLYMGIIAIAIAFGILFFSTGFVPWAWAAIVSCVLSEVVMRYRWKGKNLTEVTKEWVEDTKDE